MRDSNLARKAASSAAVLGCGLLALFGASGSAANTPSSSDTYTWSAELVAFDGETSTATVRSWVINPDDPSHARLQPGETVMLTWSGLTTAAGVRAIEPGTRSSFDRMTMPVELVSFDMNGRYVSFKVKVPEQDAEKIAQLEPGQFVTATSPHQPKDASEAVRAMRPYVNAG
jgi:hypothetical protein